MHKVLNVSYCDLILSAVSGALSTIIIAMLTFYRPYFTSKLHGKLSEYTFTSNLGPLRSKARSQGQIEGKFVKTLEALFLAR